MLTIVAEHYAQHTSARPKRQR